MWGFIFFLWFVHAIQDWLKVLVFEKYHLDNTWVFLLDQFLHIGFLGMLFPFGLARLTAPEGLSKLVFLYNDNDVIIYAIVFVAIGFGGGILISYIKNLFYGGRKVDLTSPKKYIQAIERMLIAGLMLLKGYYYFAIPGIWIIHGGYVIMKKQREERFRLSSFCDLIFNTVMAVGIMLILKLN